MALGMMGWLLRERRSAQARKNGTVERLAIFGIQNINQVNALKVVATCCANGIAVITFIVEKQVLWKYCLLTMVAAAIGGYLGARYSRGLNPAIMRSLVVVIGLGMAVYFFLKQYA